MTQFELHSLIFLTFMVNITLVDFAYNIEGAKGMALTMTLMAIFVLLSDYKLLIKYFLQEPPLFAENERPQWMNKLSKAKYIYIPLVFIGFFALILTLKNKFMGQNEFYGTWENIETFERIHFEAANSFQVVAKNESKNSAYGEYTYTTDSLTLQDSPKKEAYLKGKYQLDTNTLVIITPESGTLTYKRIR